MNLATVFVLNGGAYALVAITLGLLLYRVLRYSRWWLNPAGRSVVLLELCLASLVVFAWASLLWPTGVWRDDTRPVVVGGIWLALLYQLRVIVKSQGGWRFRKSKQPDPKVETSRRRADDPPVLR